MTTEKSSYKQRLDTLCFAVENEGALQSSIGKVTQLLKLVSDGLGQVVESGNKLTVEKTWKTFIRCLQNKEPVIRAFSLHAMLLSLTNDNNGLDFVCTRTKESLIKVVVDTIYGDEERSSRQYAIEALGFIGFSLLNQNEELLAVSVYKRLLKLLAKEVNANRFTRTERDSSSRGLSKILSAICCLFRSKNEDILNRKWINIDVLFWLFYSQLTLQSDQVVNNDEVLDAVESVECSNAQELDTLLIWKCLNEIGAFICDEEILSLLCSIFVPIARKAAGICKDESILEEILLFLGKFSPEFSQCAWFERSEEAVASLLNGASTFHEIFSKSNTSHLVNINAFSEKSVIAFQNGFGNEVRKLEEQQKNLRIFRRRYINDFRVLQSLPYMQTELTYEKSTEEKKGSFAKEDSAVHSQTVINKLHTFSSKDMQNDFPLTKSLSVSLPANKNAKVFVSIKLESLNEVPDDCITLPPVLFDEIDATKLEEGLRKHQNLGADTLFKNDTYLRFEICTMIRLGYCPFVPMNDYLDKKKSVDTLNEKNSKSGQQSNLQIGSSLLLHYNFKEEIPPYFTTDLKIDSNPEFEPNQNGIWRREGIPRGFSPQPFNKLHENDTGESDNVVSPILGSNMDNGKLFSNKDGSFSLTDKATPVVSAFSRLEKVSATDAETLNAQFGVNDFTLYSVLVLWIFGDLSEPITRYTAKIINLQEVPSQQTDKQANGSSTSFSQYGHNIESENMLNSENWDIGTTFRMTLTKETAPMNEGVKVINYHATLIITKIERDMEGLSSSFLRRNNTSSYEKKNTIPVPAARTIEGKHLFSPPATFVPIPAKYDENEIPLYGRMAPLKPNPIGILSNGTPLFVNFEAMNHVNNESIQQGDKKETTPNLQIENLDLVETNQKEAVVYGLSGMPYFLSTGGSLPSPVGYTSTGIAYYSINSIRNNPRYHHSRAICIKAYNLFLEGLKENTMDIEKNENIYPHEESKPEKGEALEENEFLDESDKFSYKAWHDNLINTKKSMKEPEVTVSLDETELYFEQSLSAQTKSIHITSSFESDLSSELKTFITVKPSKVFKVVPALLNIQANSEITKLDITCDPLQHDTPSSTIEGILIIQTYSGDVIAECNVLAFRGPCFRISLIDRCENEIDNLHQYWAKPNSEVEITIQVENLTPREISAEVSITEQHTSIIQMSSNGAKGDHEGDASANDDLVAFRLQDERLDLLPNQKGLITVKFSPGEKKGKHRADILLVTSTGEEEIMSVIGYCGHPWIVRHPTNQELISFERSQQSERHRNASFRKVSSLRMNTSFQGKKRSSQLTISKFAHPDSTTPFRRTNNSISNVAMKLQNTERNSRLLSRVSKQSFNFSGATMKNTLNVVNKQNEIHREERLSIVLPFAGQGEKKNGHSKHCYGIKHLEEDWNSQRETGFLREYLSISEVSIALDFGIVAPLKEITKYFTLVNYQEEENIFGFSCHDEYRSNLDFESFVKLPGESSKIIRITLKGTAGKEGPVVTELEVFTGVEKDQVVTIEITAYMGQPLEFPTTPEIYFPPCRLQESVSVSVPLINNSQYEFQVVLLPFEVPTSVNDIEEENINLIEESIDKEKNVQIPVSAFSSSVGADASEPTKIAPFETVLIQFTFNPVAYRGIYRVPIGIHVLSPIEVDFVDVAAGGTSTLELIGIAIEPSGYEDQDFSHVDVNQIFKTLKWIQKCADGVFPGSAGKALNSFLNRNASLSDNENNLELEEKKQVLTMLKLHDSPLETPIVAQDSSRLTICNWQFEKESNVDNYIVNTSTVLLYRTESANTFSKGITGPTLTEEQLQEKSQSSSDEDVEEEEYQFLAHHYKQGNNEQISQGTEISIRPTKEPGEIRGMFLFPSNFIVLHKGVVYDPALPFVNKGNSEAKVVFQFEPTAASEKSNENKSFLHYAFFAFVDELTGNVSSKQVIAQSAPHYHFFPRASANNFSVIRVLFYRVKVGEKNQKMIVFRNVCPFETNWKLEFVKSGSSFGYNPFSLEGDGKEGSLKPFEIKILKIYFQPDAQGNYTKSMRLSVFTKRENGENGNEVLYNANVEISGAGYLPTVSGFPESGEVINFGNVMVGGRKSVVFEVENKGFGSEYIKIFAESPFSISKENITLDKKESTKIGLYFTPSEIGSISRVVRIFIGKESRSIHVKGFAGKMEISTNLRSTTGVVDFGQRAYGTVSSCIVSFTNGGTLPVQFAGLEVVSPFLRLEDGSNNENPQLSYENALGNAKFLKPSLAIHLVGISAKKTNLEHRITDIIQVKNPWEVLRDQLGTAVKVSMEEFLDAKETWKHFYYQSTINPPKAASRSHGSNSTLKSINNSSISSSSNRDLFFGAGIIDQHIADHWNINNVCIPIEIENVLQGQNQNVLAEQLRPDTPQQKHDKSNYLIPPLKPGYTWRFRISYNGSSCLRLNSLLKFNAIPWQPPTSKIPSFLAMIPKENSQESLRTIDVEVRGETMRKLYIYPMYYHFGNSSASKYLVSKVLANSNSEEDKQVTITVCNRSKREQSITLGGITPSCFRTNFTSLILKPGHTKHFPIFFNPKLAQTEYSGEIRLEHSLGTNFVRLKGVGSAAFLRILGLETSFSADNNKDGQPEEKSRKQMNFGFVRKNIESKGQILFTNEGQIPCLFEIIIKNRSSIHFGKSKHGKGRNDGSTDAHDNADIFFFRSMEDDSKQMVINGSINPAENVNIDVFCLKNANHDKDLVDLMGTVELKWQYVPEGVWGSHEIDLLGSIGKAKLSCDTSCLDFGLVTLKGNSVKSITFKNVGTASMDWELLSINVDNHMKYGSDDTDNDNLIKQVHVHPAGGMIAPGDEFNIAVSFIAKEVVSVEGSLDFKWDGGVFSARFTAEVGIPSVQIPEDLSFDFGIVLGGDVISKEINILNTGRIPVDIEISLFRQLPPKAPKTSLRTPEDILKTWGGGDREHRNSITSLTARGALPFHPDQRSGNGGTGEDSEGLIGNILDAGDKAKLLIKRKFSKLTPDLGDNSPKGSVNKAIGKQDEVSTAQRRHSLMRNPRRRLIEATSFRRSSKLINGVTQDQLVDDSKAELLEAKTLDGDDTVLVTRCFKLAPRKTVLEPGASLMISATAEPGCTKVDQEHFGIWRICVNGEQIEREGKLYCKAANFGAEINLLKDPFAFRAENTFQLSPSEAQNAMIEDIQTSINNLRSNLPGQNAEMTKIKFLGSLIIGNNGSFADSFSLKNLGTVDISFEFGIDEKAEDEDFQIKLYPESGTIEPNSDLPISIEFLSNKSGFISKLVSTNIRVADDVLCESSGSIKTKTLAIPFLLCATAGFPCLDIGFKDRIVDFSVCQINASHERTIEMCSTGDCPVSWSAELKYSKSGPGCAFSIDQNQGIIATGESILLTISFRPTEVPVCDKENSSKDKPNYQAKLLLWWAEKEPIEVELKGRGAYGKIEWFSSELNSAQIETAEGTPPSQEIENDLKETCPISKRFVDFGTRPIHQGSRAARIKITLENVGELHTSISITSTLPRKIFDVSLPNSNLLESKSQIEKQLELIQDFDSENEPSRLSKEQVPNVLLKRLSFDAGEIHELILEFIPTEEILYEGAILIENLDGKQKPISIPIRGFGGRFEIAVKNPTALVTEAISAEVDYFSNLEVHATGKLGSLMEVSVFPVEFRSFITYRPFPISEEVNQDSTFVVREKIHKQQRDDPNNKAGNFYLNPGERMNLEVCMNPPKLGSYTGFLVLRPVDIEDEDENLELGEEKTHRLSLRQKKLMNMNKSTIKTLEMAKLKEQAKKNSGKFGKFISINFTATNTKLRLDRLGPLGLGRIMPNQCAEGKRIITNPMEDTVIVKLNTIVKTRNGARDKASCWSIDPQEATILSNESCEIVVQYSAREDGDENKWDEVSIEVLNGNTGVIDHTILAFASVGKPKLSVEIEENSISELSPERKIIDFGPCLVGSFLIARACISNEGKAMLHVKPEIASNANESFDGIENEDDNKSIAEQKRVNDRVFYLGLPFDICSFDDSDVDTPQPPHRLIENLAVGIDEKFEEYAFKIIHGEKKDYKGDIPGCQGSGFGEGITEPLYKGYGVLDYAQKFEFSIVFRPPFAHQYKNYSSVFRLKTNYLGLENLETEIEFELRGEVYEYAFDIKNLSLDVHCGEIVAGDYFETSVDLSQLVRSPPKTNEDSNLPYIATFDKNYNSSWPPPLGIGRITNCRNEPGISSMVEFSKKAKPVTCCDGSVVVWPQFGNITQLENYSLNLRIQMPNGTMIEDSENKNQERGHSESIATMNLEEVIHTLKNQPSGGFMRRNVFLFLPGYRWQCINVAFKFERPHLLVQEYNPGSKNEKDYKKKGGEVTVTALRKVNPRIQGTGKLSTASLGISLSFDSILLNQNYSKILILKSNSKLRLNFEAYVSTSKPELSKCIKIAKMSRGKVYKDKPVHIEVDCTCDRAVDTDEMALNDDSYDSPIEIVIKVVNFGNLIPEIKIPVSIKTMEYVFESQLLRPIRYQAPIFVGLESTEHLVLANVTNKMLGILISCEMTEFHIGSKSRNRETESVKGFLECIKPKQKLIFPVYYRPDSAGIHAGILSVHAFDIGEEADLDLVDENERRGTIFSIPISGKSYQAELRLSLEKVDFGFIGVLMTGVAQVVVTNPCELPVQVYISNIPACYFVEPLDFILQPRGSQALNIQIVPVAEVLYEGNICVSASPISNIMKIQSKSISTSDNTIKKELSRSSKGDKTLAEVRLEVVGFGGRVSVSVPEVVDFGRIATHILHQRSFQIVNDGDVPLDLVIKDDENKNISDDGIQKTEGSLTIMPRKLSLLPSQSIAVEVGMRLTQEEEQSFKIYISSGGLGNSKTWAVTFTSVGDRIKLSEGLRRILEKEKFDILKHHYDHSLDGKEHLHRVIQPISQVNPISVNHLLRVVQPVIQYEDLIHITTPPPPLAPDIGNTLNKKWFQARSELRMHRSREEKMRAKMWDDLLQTSQVISQAPE